MHRRTQVFLLYTSAYFLSYFLRSANAVIAPDLSQALSLGAAELGLMTSLFFGTFAVMQLPLGVGLDRWGPRWVTSGLMLVGVAGCLLFAIAPSFAVLAFGRALIGVGMAGVLMGAFKALSQWYPPERFATVSGMLVGIGSSGALMAATPLAWFNEAFGWRAVFVVGAGATMLVAFGIARWADNTPPGTVWPYKKEDGGHLRAVFGDLRFWRLAPHYFTMLGALLAFQGLWAGPYLFDVMRLDKVEAGNVLLLLGLGATAGYAASGWLADRLGLARVVIASSTVFVLCQVALVFEPPLGIVKPVYAAFGFSGAFSIMVLAHTREVFPIKMTGQAISAVNLFGISGTFIVQWGMGVVVSLFAADAAGHYPPAAYTTALLCTAAVTLMSLLWYLPLAFRRNSDPVPVA